MASRATIWRANQLRYTHHIKALLSKQMCPKGFEPPTHGLEGRCSIQLSYEHIFSNELSSHQFALVKRVMGIEPTYLAWKASVLPLNYTRIKVGVTGFEPATSWSQTRRSSQAEPHPVFCCCAVVTASAQDVVYNIHPTMSTLFLNFFHFFNFFFLDAEKP